jgi:predicted  nucleic acid-binding Zn-ribbon protein
VSPEAALGELERLVRHLGEELTFFRRRALEAERRWREVAEHHADGTPTRDALLSRIAELERENAELRSRVTDAAERTRQMAERLRFQRQQEGQTGER